MNSVKCSRAAVMFASIAVAGWFATGSAQQPRPPEKQMIVKVIARGAALHGSNGMMFDSQDRLHIASIWGNEIVVMDPANGRILQRIGADRGVFGPDDLAFGPDGSLFWASILSGEVGRLSPDGATKKQTVAAGTNPITFSPDGHLFVGLCILGDGLYELDPALLTPPASIAKQAGMLNGFDFGPDGLLYAPLPYEGRVVRMDVKAVPVKYETVASDLGVPTAVKFDSRWNLYTHNQLTGELWRADRNTGNKSRIATLYSGTDNLAFDSRDRLFVSNANDGSIHEIFMGAPRKVSPGGMILPGGVAVLDRPHGGESVYVADLWTLREFNGQTGQPGTVDEFNFAAPLGIAGPPTAVSADGRNLVISSWLTSVVQVWDPETRKSVETHRNFASPLNAIRFQGDLVVSELGTHSAIRVTAGARTVLTTDLVVPTGLAASGADLWVADWATGVIWKIVAAGSRVAIPVTKGLLGPEGLAVDQDGNLLVVESRADRLSRVDLATGAVTVLAEGLELGAPAAPNMPPTWAFNGVAVAPSGAIYVTGDKTNVLYRLR